MPPPGGDVLFDGRPVADLRETVLADIERRAAALTPESREHIPEALFRFAVFSEYDFSLPALDFDRVFSRDVEVEDTRYLELHVPMVGDPENLELSPDRGLEEGYREAFAYEIVDGDLCCYVELSGARPDAVDVATDEIIAALETRYERLEEALEELEAEAERVAHRQYRRQTRHGTRSSRR